MAAPLLPVALAGHLFLIPRFGAAGAASVSTGVAVLGAAAGVLAVCCRLQIRPPVGTLLRSSLLALIAYPIVHFRPAHGLAAVVKIAVGLALVLVGFLALGELRQSEVRSFRSTIRETLPRKSGAKLR